MSKYQPLLDDIAENAVAIKEHIDSFDDYDLDQCCGVGEYSAFERLEIAVSILNDFAETVG